LSLMLENILLFLTNRIKKMAVWKTTFASEHLNADQSQLTECFSLHSSRALPVAVLAIPTNSAARVNHAKSGKHIVHWWPTRTGGGTGGTAWA